MKFKRVINESNYSSENVLAGYDFLSNELGDKNLVNAIKKVAWDSEEVWAGFIEGLIKYFTVSEAIKIFREKCGEIPDSMAQVLLAVAKKNHLEKELSNIML